MDQKRDSLNNISQMPNTEKINAKKVWEIPHLRVLSVPAKTQSGKTKHTPPLKKETLVYRQS